MTKVAALYIATGRYTVFWPEFYESAEKYLLKDCEVHYFVFTDAATLPGDDNPRVHICAQEAYSWPFATLRRFEIFLKQEQALKAFDYIFFFNANAEFMQPVTREMLLPRAEKGEHLLVVQHPSFYAKPNYEFTGWANTTSAAASTAARRRHFCSFATRWMHASAATCSATSLRSGTMNPKSTGISCSAKTSAC